MWVLLTKISDTLILEKIKSIFYTNNITFFVVNKIDSLFLIGYYYIYVLKKDYEKAKKLISENGTEQFFD